MSAIQKPDRQKCRVSLKHQHHVAGAFRSDTSLDLATVAAIAAGHSTRAARNPKSNIETAPEAKGLFGDVLTLEDRLTGNYGKE